MNIEVTELSKEDFEIISKFSYDNYIKAYSFRKVVPESETRKKFPPPQRTSNDLWYHIKDIDCDAGYFWINVNSKKKSAFLFDVFIYPEFRGKGIGKKGLLKALSLLKNRDVGFLDLHVFSANSVARKLYEQIGFEYLKKESTSCMMRLTLK